MLVGALIVAPSSGAAAISSGLVLLAGGAMVSMRRVLYRRAFAASKGFMNVLDWADHSAPAAGQIDIAWGNATQCGHPVLDGQHRRLFGMSNALVKAILAKRPRAETGTRFEKLLGEMTKHFATEERTLASTTTPVDSVHKAEHRSMLAKGETLLEAYQRGEIGERELAGFVTYDLVIEHILKEKLPRHGQPLRLRSTPTHGVNAAARKSATVGTAKTNLTWKTKQTAQLWNDALTHRDRRTA